MVEKIVKRPHPKTLGIGVVKKVISLDLRLRHTRKAIEANPAKNFKTTTEKKLTKDQQGYYEQMLEDQRQRDEERIKKNKKKKEKLTENLM